MRSDTINIVKKRSILAAFKKLITMIIAEKVISKNPELLATQGRISMQFMFQFSVLAKMLVVATTFLICDQQAFFNQLTDDRKMKNN